MGWVVIPFGLNIVISDTNIGVLYLFAISSLSVYGILMSGLSSNSKYPFFRCTSFDSSDDFIRSFHWFCNYLCCYLCRFF
jgi:hypothetical protein